MNLLNAQNYLKDDMEGKRFYHISTEECMEVWVLKDCLQRLRLTILTPYSASKASSDHFVRAYGETYGLPYVLTNCLITTDLLFSRKLIPLFINIIQNKTFTRLWDGKYTRDWLFVEDAVSLIWFHEGKP
jgi:dTDP-glucose 4,6-dehydratase